MGESKDVKKQVTWQLFAQLNEDPSARDRLVQLHMPLVEYLARKFQGRGEPLDDLIQVGSIGLLKAIARFDPDRGIEFSTFATPTIIGEVKRYFRDHGWAIRVPRRLQELGLLISKTVPVMSQELSRAPMISEISKRLGTSDEDVLDAMEAGRSYSVASLDVPAGDDEVGRLSQLGSEDESLELFEVWSTVRSLLEKLPLRDRQVLHMRFVAGMTQTEIAHKFGISQMQVSRVLGRALAFLRQKEAED